MSPRLIRRELYHMRGVPDSPAKKWVARSKDVARVAPNKKRFAPPLVLRRVPAGRQAGSRSSETLDGEGDSESFVQFEKIDIFVAVPTRFGEQLFDGIHRCHHHPFGLDAADRLRNDSRDGLFAQARGVAFARYGQRGRAVVGARSIASGD